MANEVTIVVKVRDSATTDLKTIEGKFSASGEASGKNFGDSFTKTAGGSGSGGLFSGLFNRGGNSVAKDAESIGRDAGKALTTAIGQSAATGAADIGGSVSKELGSVLPEALSNPYVAGGAAAGIGLLAPIIAQGFSTVLVGGLGAGLAGMAIYGAMQDPKVKKTFDQFTHTANDSLKQMGVPFQGVMQDIFKTAQSVLKDMTPVFTDAAKLISGPFKQFTDTLVKAFDQPSVKQSITAIAKAFGDLLIAATPSLAKAVSQIADGITAVAKSVSANPQGLSDFIKFLGTAVSDGLKFVAWLTNFAEVMEKEWAPLWQNIGGIVKGVWKIISDTIKSILDIIIGLIKIFAALFTGNWTALWNAIKGLAIQIWNNIKDELKVIWQGITDLAKSVWNSIQATVKSIWNSIAGFFKQVWKDIQGYFNDALKWIKSTASTTWNDVEKTVKQVWNDIIKFFSNTWASIEKTAKADWNDLSKFFTGLWATIKKGVTDAWNDIIKFFSGIPGKVKGYFSDAGHWLSQAGKDVIQGFLNGLKQIWTDVTNFISGIASWIKSHKGPQSLDNNLLVDAGKGIMGGFLNGLKNKYKDVTNFITGVAKGVAGAFTGGPSQAGTGAFGGNVEQLMIQMAQARGYSASQIQSLIQVENREAGFNLTAQNPSSGAYGLAQFIDGPSEYAQYGGDLSASGQITAMLNYISQRYGTSDSAWAHELAYGWYDQGGWLQPGYTLAYNGTGAPERVGGTGGTSVSFEIGSSGNKTFDSLMLEWMRENVRIKGGGNVQKAFGRNR